jgi:hypothetical protein
VARPDISVPTIAVPLLNKPNVGISLRFFYIFIANTNVL